MILKLLRGFGFDFSKLPPDVNNAVSLLDRSTAGTFESNNQKLNVLDETIFKSIKHLHPTDEAVIFTDELVKEVDSEIVNDGFNTVLREEEGSETAPSAPKIDENFNRILIQETMENKAADGLLVGNSHADGGIKIQTPEGQIEAEGGEVIINKRALALDEEYVCTGTPKDITSKINELEGGVSWSQSGSCRIVKKAADGSEVAEEINKADDGVAVQYTEGGKLFVVTADNDDQAELIEMAINDYREGFINKSELENTLQSYSGDEYMIDLSNIQVIGGVKHIYSQFYEGWIPFFNDEPIDLDTKTALAADGKIVREHATFEKIGDKTWNFEYSRNGIEASGIIKKNDQTGEFDYNIEDNNFGGNREDSVNVYMALEKEFGKHEERFSKTHVDKAKWGMNIFKREDVGQSASTDADRVQVKHKIMEMHTEWENLRMEYRFGGSHEEYIQHKKELLARYKPFIDKATAFGIVVSAGMLSLPTAEKGTSVRPNHIQAPAAPVRFGAYKIYSATNPDYPQWEGTESEIRTYLDEVKESIIDYNPNGSWEENLAKLGLTYSDVKIEEVTGTASSGSILRSQDAAKRPSPSVSATIYPAGYELEGNDGNMWVISVASNGVHRWTRKKAEDGEQIVEQIEEKKEEKIEEVAKYINIGFDAPTAYKPSAWARARRYMEKLVELGYITKDNLGRGKGKYWTNEKSDALGGSLSHISERLAAILVNTGTVRAADGAEVADDKVRIEVVDRSRSHGDSTVTFSYDFYKDGVFVCTTDFEVSFTGDRSESVKDEWDYFRGSHSTKSEFTDVLVADDFRIVYTFDKEGSEITISDEDKKQLELEIGAVFNDKIKYVEFDEIGTVILTKSEFWNILSKHGIRNRFHPVYGEMEYLKKTYAENQANNFHSANAKLMVGLYGTEGEKKYVDEMISKKNSGTEWSEDEYNSIMSLSNKYYNKYFKDIPDKAADGLTVVSSCGCAHAEDGKAVPYKEPLPPFTIEDSGSPETVREIGLTLKDANIPVKKIGSSKDAYDYLWQIWDKNAINIQEEFVLLYMDRKNEVKGYQKLSKGGIAGTVVDAELILATASKALASGIIIAHNHPSGSLQPSEEDKRLTKSLTEALRLIRVNLLDSIILSPIEGAYYSFMDEGIMIAANGIELEESHQSVIDQMNIDLENGNTSAIRKLISNAPAERLLDYLADGQSDDLTLPELIDKTVGRVIEDLENYEYDGIENLLSFIPEKNISSYLPSDRFNNGGGVGKVDERTIIDFVKALEDSGIAAKDAHKNDQFVSTVKSIISLSKKDVKESNPKVKMIYSEYNDWIQTYSNGGGVGEEIVLKSKLTSGKGEEYRVVLIKNDNTYKSVIRPEKYSQKMEEWISTGPGWQLGTLLGIEGFYGNGRTGDKVYLDMGQNWYVTGMSAVLNEAEETIGVKAANGTEVADAISYELQTFDLKHLDPYETRLYNDYIKHSSKEGALRIIINSVEGDYTQLSPKLAELAEQQRPSGRYGDDEDGMAANGKAVMVVTKISDIPNLQQKVDAGQVSYRGLGMGKLSNDFYKLAGEDGTRIKVDGKEYFITDTDFRKLNWDFENNKWLGKIKFDAPHRKAADGKSIGDINFVPAKKFGNEQYYTIGPDDGEKALYSSKEIELIKSGYRIEPELDLKATRHPKEKLEAYLADLRILNPEAQLVFSDHEFGGSWRIYIKNKAADGRELWFHPSGRTMKTEPVGTALTVFEGKFAQMIGVEGIDLFSENEKEYVFELKGNPVTIGQRVLQLEDKGLDFETYGAKKLLHMPKEVVNQALLAIRYPLLTPFGDGGSLDHFKAIMQQAGITDDDLKWINEIEKEDAESDILWLFYGKYENKADAELAEKQLNSENYAARTIFRNGKHWVFFKMAYSFGDLEKVAAADGMEINDTDDNLANSILRKAVMGNFITVEKANEMSVQGVAVEVSFDHRDDEEIGSSDMTFILKEFLDGIGVETYWENGTRLALKAKNGTSVSSRGYAILMPFMKELLKTFNLKAEVTSAILLDAITRSYERLVIDIPLLIEETNDESAEKKVKDIAKKHSVTTVKVNDHNVLIYKATKAEQGADIDAIYKEAKERFPSTLEKLTEDEAAEKYGTVDVSEWEKYTNLYKDKIKYAPYGLPDSVAVFDADTKEQMSRKFFKMYGSVEFIEKAFDYITRHGEIAKTITEAGDADKYPALVKEHNFEVVALTRESYQEGYRAYKNGGPVGKDISKADREKYSNMVYQMEVTEDVWKKSNPEAWKKTVDDFAKFHKKLYGDSKVIGQAADGSYIAYIDKVLTDKGFDVSKLSQEKKELILMPSMEPENYSMDGEISAGQAMTFWLEKLSKAGLDRHDIKKAVQANFARNGKKLSVTPEIYTSSDGINYWVGQDNGKWTVFSEGKKEPMVWAKRNEFDDEGLPSKEDATMIAKNFAGVGEEEDPEAFFWRQTEMANGGAILEEMINADIIDEEHPMYKEANALKSSNDTEKINELLEEMLNADVIDKSSPYYKKVKSVLKKATGYQIELSAEPNPDFSPGSHEATVNIPVKKVSVKSIDEARKRVIDFISENDLGSGNWTGGQIYQNGKPIAHISYNGKVWEGKQGSSNYKEFKY